MTDRRLRIRLKLGRARKHLRELKAAIAAFRESQPFKVSSRPHPVARIAHTTLYVEFVRSISDEILLIIGDTIHNLRSCLDHLAWQLVLANGNTPDRDTNFPIFDPAKSPTAKAQAGIGNGMSEEAKELIRRTQPRVSGDHTLWHLHELDIVDKHRLLIAAGLATGGWKVDVEKGVTVEFPSPFSFSLKAGHEITNLPTSTYQKRKLENFKLSLELVFDEPQIVQFKPVLRTPEDMTTFIDK